MAFSESTIKAAWERAGGKCECTRVTHSHGTRCNKQLVWENRGREGRGKWEAHHKTAVSSGGNDNLSNCEIVCFECHKGTQSFGK